MSAWGRHKRKFTPFSKVADACVGEHGGTVDKRFGNRVMAAFRAPVAYGRVPNDAFAIGCRVPMRAAELGANWRAVGTWRVVPGSDAILSTPLPACRGSRRLLPGYGLSLGASNAG
jgi:hypothetical protein